MRKAMLLLALGLAACQPAVHTGVACTETQGTVHVMHLTQKDIGEAYPYTIHVYLPACYDEETERRYPVLFLFPGRASGPGTWFSSGAGRVADAMIAEGKVPPFIIVTLQNTVGDLMALDFWEHVFPYVDSHYRILDDARFRAIGGGSMGGAPSYRMSLQHPDTFGAMALFGSGIITGEEERVTEWLEAIPDWQKPRAFFNTGLQDVLLVPRAQELEALFAEFGIPTETIYTDGPHGYGYWVSNFDELYTWLAEGWR